MSRLIRVLPLSTAGQITDPDLQDSVNDRIIGRFVATERPQQTPLFGEQSGIGIGEVRQRPEILVLVGGFVGRLQASFKS